MRDLLKNIQFAAAMTVNLLIAQQVQAETIYRCGPDLKQYSQQPCEGGRTLEVNDRRNADQVSQGHAAARSHARAEHDIERDLNEMNRRAPSFGSLSPRPVAQPASAKNPAAKPKPGNKKSKHKQVVEGSEFSAVDPSTANKKQGTKATKASKTN